jgi:hypothetical protein
MSIDALRAVLDGLEEASSCSGTVRPNERVAIALPDGDVGAVDDPGFVDWLLAHSEQAPYGHGAETKIDPKVRNAKRLVARDNAEVHGFDPQSILAEIEAVLSPGAHLDAKLTDVIVYPKGGKFDRHKDTPRAKDLIGTLVVGLPIAHTGGTFVVDDGRTETKHDWSQTPKDVLPWVALFSDVDHSIEDVKSGSRVTLVYSLHRTDRAREDAKWVAHRAALAAAARDLKPPKWPLMIACNRHAVGEPGTEQPQEIETLRGVDRELADILVEAGYGVAVRACIAPIPNYDPVPTVERGAFPPLASVFFMSRMSMIPPIEVFEDEYGVDEYILDAFNSNEQWLVRKNAGATFAHESEWAEPGNFGNEGFAALLYTLAAIEVTKGGGAKKKPAPKKAAKAAAKPTPAKKTPAKKAPAKKAAAKKKPAAKKKKR